MLLVGFVVVLVPIPVVVCGYCRCRSYWLLLVGGVFGDCGAFVVYVVVFCWFVCLCVGFLCLFVCLFIHVCLFVCLFGVDVGSCLSLFFGCCLFVAGGGLLIGGYGLFVGCCGLLSLG